MTVVVVFHGHIFIPASSENDVIGDNWASEASPTLGCSIEISRDIYIYVLYVCRYVSYVKLTA